MAVVKANYPANTSVSAGHSGKDLLLYVNYGASATESAPVWVLVGGLTDTSFNSSLNVENANTKSTGYWQSAAVVSKEAEVSFSAVSLESDLGQQVLKEFVADDDITREKGSLHFLLADTKNLNGKVFWAVPSSLEINASADGLVEISMSATVIGGYKEVTITISSGTPSISA